MSAESDWRGSHADPWDLRRHADDLANRLGRLTDAYSPLRRAVDAAQWRGQAADSFFGLVGDCQNRVQSARSALENAVSVMRSEADRLQRELEDAQRQDRERAARAAHHW